MCKKITTLLQQNREITIISAEGLHLTINSTYEKPIANTGNFSHQPYASAGFPIGEIFTEAKDLKAMNGTLRVFGFPDLDHRTFFCEPFQVQIKEGKLIIHNGPPEFEQILQRIREGETDIHVREIGFGLNRSLGFDQHITEPTGFERFAGMHFSLGLKHDMYRNKLSKKIFQKYHIDLFCLVEKVLIGDTMIFEKGGYIV